MWAEKGRYVLAVMPSADEMDRLQFENKPVGERVGVTQPDAKIELRPLSQLERDTSGRIEIVNRRLVTLEGDAVSKAQLLTNGDITIYLSRFAISERPSEGVSIARSAIETPLIADETFRRRLLEAAIPTGGIVVDFTQMYTDRSHPH